MWNPNQYNKFSNERNRPAYELISRIPNNDFNSIIDLGCGTGSITKILQDQYHPDIITGLDSSDSMIEKAKTDYPNINWQLGDIAQFTGEYDLIFSNAALQWLDNHDILLNKIISRTRKVLAIQMPNNFNYPSHVLLRETIYENEKFYKKLASIIRESPVHSKEAYFKILYKQVSYLDIWETTYLQQLSGNNAVLEWVRGTALVPIKDKLDSSEYEEFELCYNEKLLKAYPPLDNGTTLFPFSRLFIVAIKQ